jgi:hypothetical protein
VGGAKNVRGEKERNDREVKERSVFSLFSSISPSSLLYLPLSSSSSLLFLSLPLISSH